MLYTLCDKASRAIKAHYPCKNQWTTKYLLHAYLDIMEIIYLKFHEIPFMCLGGVALTRMYGQTDGVIPIYLRKHCLAGYN